MAHLALPATFYEHVDARGQTLGKRRDKSCTRYVLVQCIWCLFVSKDSSRFHHTYHTGMRFENLFYTRHFRCPAPRFALSSSQKQLLFTGLVHIFDRHGQRVDEISLQGNGPILSLDWDVDGVCLAVLQEGNGVIPIWDSSSRTTLSVDTNLKDPSFMAWSSIGPQLAVGTAKGNILMYNKNTRKKIPVLGKHPRRIICGAWSYDNQLVLGSMDNTMTVSNDTGDTLDQTQLKRSPTGMCFIGAKRGRGGRPSSAQGRPTTSDDNVVAVNLSGKSLLLYNLSETDRPVELAFQPKYGTIVVHRPFGDRYALIGFSEVSNHQLRCSTFQCSCMSLVGESWATPAP